MKLMLLVPGCCHLEGVAALMTHRGHFTDGQIMKNQTCAQHKLPMVAAAAAGIAAAAVIIRERQCTQHPNRIYTLQAQCKMQACSNVAGWII